ncbi:MAG: hypothetical protein JKY08_10730 [Flavobacteriaceae bacterium]|nr:hypothetical protein [Flavobacteriaceae bacterium]
MKEKEVFELTDEELLEKAKTSKQKNLFDAVLIGVLIGISLYSIYTNGFGLLTFIPLIYIPIAVRNNAEIKELKKLLKERNLV